MPFTFKLVMFAKLGGLLVHVYLIAQVTWTVFGIGELWSVCQTTFIEHSNLFLLVIVMLFCNFIYIVCSYVISF